MSLLVLVWQFIIIPLDRRFKVFAYLKSKLAKLFSSPTFCYLFALLIITPICTSILMLLGASAETAAVVSVILLFYLWHKISEEEEARFKEKQKELDESRY
jgi:hypothetical protein